MKHLATSIKHDPAVVAARELKSLGLFGYVEGAYSDALTIIREAYAGQTAELERWKGFKKYYHKLFVLSQNINTKLESEIAALKAENERLRKLVKRYGAERVELVKAGKLDNGPTQKGSGDV